MASQERGDRCYYNLRAQIKLYGEVDIQDSERSSLRECLYGCNGKVMCSDSNRHNGHLDPKNPQEDYISKNYCNGAIKISDIDLGKCVWKIKAESLENRNEKMTDLQHICGKCDECIPEKHKDCYVDVRDYVRLEEEFGYRKMKLLDSL